MAYAQGAIKGDDPTVTELYGERTAATSCTHLLPYLTSTSKILDIGCGPGTITHDLAVLCPQGHVTGLDNSPGIISQASTTYSAPNLTFAIGDATNLKEYADGEFDVVHVHALLVHIPDPVNVLREMRRVCKIGGIVSCRETSMVVVLSLKPDLPAIRQYWARAQAVMKQMGSHADAGLKLAEWAKDAGFTGGDGDVGGKVVESRSPQWHPSHVDRMRGEPREQAIKYGTASEEEMDEWEKVWGEWGAAEGHEFVVECGEILCWKGK